MQVELNGRTIDLSKAVPIVMKDWKVLAKAGITWARLSNAASDPEAALAYILHVLQKADPTVTAEEIEQLTDAQMLELYGAITEANKAAGVLIPFSWTRPTSSDVPTGGPSPTSSN